jgi:SpoVK/Ycf46/Vps4 family AAA+-type ATPase
MVQTNFVAERFKRVVTLHVVKNFFSEVPSGTPLILGIHGPSGSGKTYQCKHSLMEMGVRTFLISGGQLESGTAGEPARIVREAYISASRSIEKGDSSAAVLLINDVDTGLGNWGDKVQTTINTQTVYGELMHLVDYPNFVGGISTKRIPIILTGNDFTKLYSPLVRAGRMTSFEWSPTVQEKCQVVKRIFPELVDSECENLVNEFLEQPIAFFSHLRSTLIDDILWEEVQRLGILKTIQYISSGKDPGIKIRVEYSYLKDSATKFLLSSTLMNHLRK